MTGWIDSWVLAAKAKHRNCAYRWFQYTSTPAVQAQIAKAYGAAPVSASACTAMERETAGSCFRLYGKLTPALLRSVRFWKTPLADCGRAGSAKCVGYADWQRAWVRIQG
jgi:putative spermidine/putrescine transport system substrate-binding protein